MSKISYQGPSQSATGLSPNIPLYRGANDQAAPVLSPQPRSEGSGIPLYRGASDQAPPVLPHPPRSEGSGIVEFFNLKKIL